MIALQLAFKNILGAGLRSLLNVVVLSFAFVVILWHNGVIDGWNQQARRDTIAWETGQGQVWHPAYDPLDYLSFQDAHAPLPPPLQKEVAAGKLTPILIGQATAFPQGRMQGVLLKGVDPAQNILKLPTQVFDTTSAPAPALIGRRMAEILKLKQGDPLLIRWRDRNGAFDATELTIAGIFSCNVPSVDAGQIWLPLQHLQQMLSLPGEATLLVASSDYTPTDLAGWQYKDTQWLLADLDKIIQSKKGSGAVLYGLLLVIALLAIFDTQVLSVFRRQREIGTYIALGMTRQQVVGIFTIEGTAYSLLAIVLGALYGAPLLYYLAKTGWAMPAASAEMGIALAERIYPVFGAQLVLGTVLLITATATLVSFLPARKIAKIHPVDAIKGKIQ